MQPNARGHYLIMPMGVELGLRLENGVSWLHWWDDAGNLLLTGAEKAVQAEQKQVQAEAIAEQQKAIAAQERLAKEQPEAIANQERDQKEKLANYSRIK
jgi:hypothetical protein